MKVENIPITAIHPSPMNPRKTFDEGDLQELADNIAKQGLLQPITVRPAECEPSTYDEEARVFVKGEPTTYEIICGERRYRATKMLHDQGLLPHGTIAAIVREMDDEQAFDAMITENLQRKDVDPMEEAFAFGQLVKKGKTAEEIAARFGKSIRFVQDRCKLNALIPELMLAVRDDRMSISAALIISKLPEDDQRRYHSAYSNNAAFNKASADSFVNALFMTLDQSPWYESDDQEDEDFEGGCGRKCSECAINTANHGCLFWEMKAENAGRCTSREMFNKKNAAYLLHTVEQYHEDLVKAGEPLESGKTVIVGNLGVCSDYIRDFSKEAFSAIRSAGYEVVDSSEIFDGVCWYTDGRLDKLIKRGCVYRVLSLFSYSTVDINERWMYIRGKAKDPDAKATASAPSTQSVEALKLVQKVNRAKEIAIEEITKKQREMAQNLEAARRMGELSDNEQLAFDIILFTLLGKKMLEKYGHKEYGKPTDRSFIEIVKQNQADRNSWIREFIRTTIASTDITFNSLIQHCAGLVLSEWKTKEHEEMVSSISLALDKKMNKLKEKLETLGYDIHGKLLPNK